MDHSLYTQDLPDPQLLQGILANLAGGLCAVDASRRVLYLNPAGAQMLGWPCEDLLGGDVHAHLHPKCEAGLSSRHCPLCQALSSTEPSRHDADSFTRKDGQTIPVAYTVTPLCHNEQFVGHVISFRDMTTLSSLQRRHEDYLALVAHDVRNPLVAIHGFASLLDRRLSKYGLEDEARQAQRLLTAVQHLERLVVGMLDLSGLEQGQRLPMEDLDLVELLSTTIEQVHNAAGRIHLVAPERVVVRGNQVQLERVALNLLTNAVKYGPGVSPILVRVCQEGEWVRVTVEDHGIGLKPEDLARVFEKFYRADPHKGVPGSGLGLYISRLIVEAHGGTIWAESVVGQGSTFGFGLPVHAASPWRLGNPGLDGLSEEA